MRIAETEPRRGVGSFLKPRDAKKVTSLVPRDGFRAKSVEKLDDLESCERVMKESFQRFAEAVAAIRRKKLFLEAGYKTFVDYCRERWGWTSARGYQIVEANKTIQSLPKSIQPLVENERTARALSDVKETKREVVVRRVINSGEALSARSVTEAIKPRERERKKPVVIDVTPEPKTAKTKTCPNV